MNKETEKVTGKPNDRLRYVDASGLVLGKLASTVAKRALNKDFIVIVNAEKSIINGNPQFMRERWKTRLDLEAKGNPEKGPKASKMPDLMLKYAIRGMMNFKDTRGREAIRRVRVHIGVPKVLSGKKFESIEQAKANPTHKSIELGELCKLLGAKQ